MEERGGRARGRGDGWRGCAGACEGGGGEGGEGGGGERVEAAREVARAGEGGGGGWNNTLQVFIPRSAAHIGVTGVRTTPPSAVSAPKAQGGRRG